MLGFNFRMDELRAALALVQLKGLPGWNGSGDGCRCGIATHGAHCPSVIVPFAASWPSAHHLTPALLPADVDRQTVIDRLRKRGYSDHRSLSPRAPSDVLQRSPSGASFVEPRSLPTGAHAAASSRMMQSTVEFVVNFLAVALGAEFRWRPSRDRAWHGRSLSGPSPWIQVGLRRPSTFCVRRGGDHSRASDARRGACHPIESGRPILFSQRRLGQYGRQFRMHKFRNFRPDCNNRGCPLTVEGDDRMTGSVVPRRRQAGRVASALERSVRRHVTGGAAAARWPSRIALQRVRED